MKKIIMFLMLAFFCLSCDVGIPITVNGDHLIVDKPIRFKTGKAEILQDSYEVLDSLALFLKNAPEIKVEIQIYSDSVGDSDINQKVTQQRADFIRDALNDRGIDPARVESKGYGESNPIASNETSDGRLKNRRLVIKIK